MVSLPWGIALAAALPAKIHTRLMPAVELDSDRADDDEYLEEL